MYEIEIECVAEQIAAKGVYIKKQEKIRDFLWRIGKMFLKSPRSII